MRQKHRMKVIFLKKTEETTSLFEIQGTFADMPHESVNALYDVLIGHHRGGSAL